MQRLDWEERAGFPSESGLPASGDARPQFRADENVRDGLARIAAALIQPAVDRIENVGPHRAKDLHQVRVTSKRLRALLRLIRPVIARKFYSREDGRLKDLARGLSSFRDTAVARQTLEKLAEHASRGQDAKALSRVTVHLEVQSPGANQVGSGSEQALKRAATSLVETNHSLQNMLVPAEDWKALGSGLQRVYRRARQCMLRALAYDTDEAFHDWRKEVKFLYYQLQMLDPIWPKRLGTMTRRLNKLEDKLGSDHDLVVLGKRLARSPRKYGGKATVKRVTAFLDQRSERLRSEVQELASEVFRDKPRKFGGRLEKRWRVWHRPPDEASRNQS